MEWRKRYVGPAIGMLKEAAGLGVVKLHCLGARNSAAPSSIIADVCCACRKATKQMTKDFKNWL